MIAFLDHDPDDEVVADEGKNDDEEKDDVPDVVVSLCSFISFLPLNLQSSSSSLFERKLHCWFFVTLCFPSLVSPWNEVDKQDIQDFFSCVSREPCSSTAVEEEDDTRPQSRSETWNLNRKEN